MLINLMYVVCRSCGQITHKNIELSLYSSFNCANCGNPRMSMCWWVAHSDVESEGWGDGNREKVLPYRDEILKKCKNCGNRFICHTSLPKELNSLAGR